MTKQVSKVVTIRKHQAYQVNVRGRDSGSFERSCSVRIHFAFSLDEQPRLFMVCSNGELGAPLSRSSPVGKQALQALALHVWGK